MTWLLPIVRQEDKIVHVLAAIRILLVPREKHSRGDFPPPAKSVTAVVELRQKLEQFRERLAADVPLLSFDKQCRTVALQRAAAALQQFEFVPLDVAFDQRDTWRRMLREIVVERRDSDAIRTKDLFALL